MAIARYEAALKTDAKDAAARCRARRDLCADEARRVRAVASIAKQREAADKHLASLSLPSGSRRTPNAPRTAASILKDAAAAWIEADDKPRALEAAKKSLASLPEIGTSCWSISGGGGLGDVFLAAGEPAQAIPQFEAALAVVKIDGYRKDTEKQLADAKAAAAKKP